MTREGIFHDALAMPLAERPAFLDAACAGQPELRARVKKLLAAHDGAGGSLVADLATDEYRPAPATQPGDIFAGRYKLREKVGEGGMGSAFVADQFEPMDRRRVGLQHQPAAVVVLVIRVPFVAGGGVFVDR